MSVKDENTEILNEEVVVDEVSSTEMMEVEKEAKRAKRAKIAKTAGKVAVVAGIGALAYILGFNKGKKSSTYDDSETIDVEYETEDVE